MEEIDIKLFDKITHCSVYSGKNINILFNGHNYRNQLVYLINRESIPTNLKPQNHQCVKNAYYVGKLYGAQIIEGLVIVFLQGAFTVQIHCWNCINDIPFDTTPFIREPDDIVYIPFRTFKHNEYRDAFGKNTKQYTFLSGGTILSFESETTKAINSIIL